MILVLAGGVGACIVDDQVAGDVVLHLFDLVESLLGVIALGKNNCAKEQQNNG